MNSTDDQPLGESPALAAFPAPADLAAAVAALNPESIATRQAKALQAIRARATQWRDDENAVAQVRAAGAVILRIIDEANV